MRDIVRVLYHAIVIISIGSCGMFTVINTAVSITQETIVISVLHLILGIIALLFAMFNLYNFKITEL